MSGIVLRICTSCRPVPDPACWARLEAALAAAGLPEPVTLARQACMNGCAHPQSLALQGAGRATYFFAGVDLEADRADILATCRAYISAPGGWIEDARPCGRLRLCLVGRVPAL